jgi:hypothetical protein
MRRVRRATLVLGPYGRLLVTSELLLAVGATVGGLYLMVTPTTAFPAAWLAGTPWTSWLWPGLALIICNGAVPVAVAIGALRDRPIGHLGHPLVGFTLVGWVAMEMTLVGDVSPAQPFLLAFGVALLTLGLAHVHRWRDDPLGGGRGVEVPWLW